MRTGLRAVVAGLLMGLVGWAATSCTDEDGGADGVAADGVPADGVVVLDAWIRPTPPVTNVGAFYLTVANGTDRTTRIVGASSPRCADIEIHRTSTVDGVATMALAEPPDLEIDPGGELVMEPSNLHVMCLGLTEPVADGDRIPLTIELTGAGERTVEAVAESR